MAKIKICGIMKEQDIDVVNTALPDYIGFVFAQSKRRIDERNAKGLRMHLDPQIKVVGVFVNEEIGRIIKLCEAHVIDLIQLHGDEDEIYVKRLKYYTSNEIIKAVRVRDFSDIERAMEFSCEYLLYDAYHEGIYGGVGKTFDWSMIRHMNKPYFLAGGINSGNIARAIEQFNPYCIDVSSGTETNGYKDPKKILDIVARAKRISKIR